MIQESKHPQSLKVFFATEMWERYGFYVIQTLLALYLSLHLHWKDETVYALVGSFTALTYLWPIAGGFIADNFIGQRVAIFAGCFILFLSYTGLSLANSYITISIFLAAIAIGTGLLKPNISSLLGNEYDENSSQRENGFTIFYIGLTTGILFGTTLPSLIYKSFGWRGAFLSAAFGTIIAALSFAYGIFRYKIQDYHLRAITVENTIKALGLLLIFWILASLVLYCPALANTTFICVLMLSVVYLVYRIKNDPKEQSKKTIIILVLCFISTMFWAFYFQMFLSLTLFITRLVKIKIFGINFPAPYYVAVQSLGMMIFGIWFSRKKRDIKNTSQYVVATMKKFFLAMLTLSIAYAIINVVCRMPIPISPFVILPAYLCISIAELLLSPVGLSAMTVLAARNKVSTMMGIFFVSLGLGAYFAGKLANLTAIPSDNLSILAIRQYYMHGFMQVFVILVIATCASYFLYALTKKYKYLFY